MCKLNRCQSKAMTILRSGRNVCLTGDPGTGKTFIMNAFIKEQQEAGKNIIMTAPTGIAALKIDGVTMHNAFGIPVPAYGKYEFDIPDSKVKPMMNVDIFIIEEISMCRNDVFEYFTNFIKKMEKMKKENGIKKKIQVIVSGDFMQLPPIVKKDEESAFKRLGLDMSGYCFTSPSWDYFKFKIVKLDTVVRQSDPEFVSHLTDLRKGYKRCIRYFNKRVIKEEEKESLKDAIYICSTNAEVDRINDERLNEIDAPCVVYKAKKSGRTAKDYTADEYLMLKPGAKVMFIANDTNGDKYRNGQMGVVKACLQDKVIVTTERNGVEEDIYVTSYRWPTNSISVVNGMASKKEIGAYEQIPIKLAYAITMHKTQGQTYDNVLISPNAFAEGQLYVAISRVTTLEGLHFTTEILPEYIKVSSLVSAFYDGKYVVPATRVTKKKNLEAKALQKHKEKKRKKRTTTKKTTKRKIATKRKTTTTKKRKVTKK